LRATEKARSIVHVPRVLLHRDGSHGASDDPDYAAHAGRAIAAALDRRGEAASILASGPGTFVVRYTLRGGAPRVTIVLPTRDHADDLERCLASVFQRTTYANFELLLVDNGTREAAALETIERYARADARLRVLPMDVPFNYSRLNNAAVREATGEVLVLLNNDTEIVTPDWLEALLEQALRPAIGAVGANLLYPDGRVQHGGVVLGIGGVAGHSHRGYPPGDAGYFGALRTITNYSAVTAACLAVRRSVYDAVGGLDETLTVAFNDVDFCLRIRAAGYRNVWLPHVVLRHGESRSRGHDIGLAKTHRSLAESRVMLDRWHATIDDDPYYSPHLTRLDESYGIRVEV
jgi:GT2 family glycosyltransferase